MDNVRFVVAGYGLTGVLLAGYVAALYRRARRARARTAAIAEKRDARA